MRLVFFIIFFITAVVSYGQQKVYYSIENTLLENADTVSSYYYEIVPLKKTNKSRKEELPGLKTTIAYYSKTNTVYYKQVPSSPIESTKTYYYPGGELKFVAEMLFGLPRGTIVSYYKNGSVKSELVFEAYDQKKESERIVGIITYNDSTGKALVDKGNGICNCDLDPTAPDKFYETGIVKDGLKIGQWIGKSSRRAYSFAEVYKEGQLFFGILTVDSLTYKYVKREVQPTYPEGMNAMLQLIAKNMRYPAGARARGIQGNVYVSFVVDTDGKVIEPKILDGVSKDIDAEALRVVSLMPAWSPGKVRGQPVKVKFTLPIKFKLG